MKYWLILIVAFTIVSCQDVNQPKKPKNLIAKDKMADVLTEAYLANAARSVDNKSLVVRGVEMDSLIYTKFGIDSLQFVKSNDYYSASANSYLEIFQRVEDNLKSLEKNLDSIRELNYNKQDTVPKEPVQNKMNMLSKDSLP